MPKMVVSKTEMKRKRKEGCSSPILDDSPKRTKVHAQRKFAQGSNVNSPVITPVKEIERQEMDVLPEPVELLPIKRPNTEDFLTFLCFRGTPILPPSLNFFNTASIVDNNGQVHEIKSESSPKNGPIDTSSISKSGSGSNERPFIAFGVRKRADPIVISRQMDKKRRHALALQALRRKYQEQRMAKIRAVTISKLSEKVSTKSNTNVSKSETVTKKTSTNLPKTKTPEVKETKKVNKIVQPQNPQQDVKTTLRSQIKPKMCLRSFRGRFVQKELQFKNVKKRPLSIKKKSKNETVKKNNKKLEDEEDDNEEEEEAEEEDENEEEDEEISSEYDSEDEEQEEADLTSPSTTKIAKKSAPGPKKPSDINFRVTRSNKFVNTKVVTRRQQIKQQLLSTPKTNVKPRTLRSNTQILLKSPEVVKSRLMQLKVQKEKQCNRKSEIVIKKIVTKSKKCVVPVRKILKVENVKKMTKVTESIKKTMKADTVKKQIDKNVGVKNVIVINKSPTKFKMIDVRNKVIKKSPIKDNKKSSIQIVKKSIIKNETAVKKESIKKETKEEDNETKESELKTQRPSRKTKEAAAIYMELLSQKLVNESRIDDDNVSIDSFPELPNVKRIEQRENELKAKAEREIEKKTVKSKDRESDKRKKESPEKIIEKKKATSVKKEDSKSNSDEKNKKTQVDKKIIKDDKKQKSPVHKVNESVESKKLASAKRKLNKKSESEESSESETASIKQKTKKSEIGSKRQTRNSSQNVRQQKEDEDETEDSDESFRADIRIPRKRQVTRSKVTKKYEESDDDEEDDDEKEESPKPDVKKSSRTKPTNYLECTFFTSDMSSTSEVNKPASKQAKKFTKTKNAKKNESFSDSDEEPLSKLTQKSGDSSKITKKDAETVKTETESKNKPKRECAKRPQNYLPMFSSSDEGESLFQDYEIKSDLKQSQTSQPEIKKNVEPVVLIDSAPALELKDISRRFGKGKVNMSNEQIEKWLNDAALAGNCVRNENDEMLKFGEKIPTETSFSVANLIDTEKLKTSLLVSPIKDGKKELLDEVSSKASDEFKNFKPSQMIDKKFIFRNKDKIIITSPSPNAKAFSANNESSVYAFGDDDDLAKTPFRRPNRRPSSTATSRSEDDSSLIKIEDKLPGQFRKPNSLKQEIVQKLNKDDSSESINVEDVKTKSSPIPPKSPGLSQMVPPSNVYQKSVMKSTKLARPGATNSETFEEFRYKVPSSPSASSSSSAKLYKKQTCLKTPKSKLPEVNPINVTEFPISSSSGQLVEAPIFHPNEKEFQDPLEYIEKIRSKAEQFGICRIIPPSTFKPECKVTDDMRFTAYNQYVHKMLHRWGPNFKELLAIKKYLSTQNIILKHPPWIGGMEVDLPRLYQTVQLLGGLKEVIEKKKWSKVSDAMKFPKSAQDRVTKLDDIYCKYLLPYDTLSPAEREKLFAEVESDWTKRQAKSENEKQNGPSENEKDEEESESESDDEIDECTVKGRSMALNAFYRIARNTMSMWFKTTEPPADEVEQEFWRHVQQKQNHICVHSGSIDSGNWGYGFAVSKNSPFARHAWNLKVLTNNSGSVLRSMGPVMGVTVPTLHVGMVFSSGCWYRDPHGLPWIEYLHTGGNKIWYGIPDATSEKFHGAMKKIVPNYCLDKTLWLPSDTVMVPPNLLVENGVSLSRTVQEPGQFVVVFPKVFTSSLSTGYVVSESVYFATPKWLQYAKGLFMELRNSCEPSMFSFDRLILSIVNDVRSSVEVLMQIIPAVQELCDREKMARNKIKDLGVVDVEKLPTPESKRKGKKVQEDEDEYECEVCRMNLFVSMVTESENDGVYCLDHAIEEIDKKNIESKKCKLSYTYDDDELNGLIGKIQMSIATKVQKKLPNSKFIGMPTLLTK